MADREKAEQLMEQNTMMLAESIVRKLTGHVAERDGNVEFVFARILQIRRERVWFRDRVAKALKMGETGSVVVAIEALVARGEALEEALRGVMTLVDDPIPPEECKCEGCSEIWATWEAARKLLEKK